MNIAYDTNDPWSLYPKVLNRIIDQYGCKSLCEIGGGAFPALSLEQVLAKELDYTVLDISQVELDRAPAGYNKLLADICAPDLKAQGKYDFIFSKMLAEHVKDPVLFHRNVLSLLKKGGIALHFFPTLYAFPFLVNWLIPERVAQFIFRLFVCKDPVKHKRFPVHYKWCKGPTKKQITNLQNLGYEIVEYRGFYGHRYYDKIPVLRGLQKIAGRFFCGIKNPFFTSFAFIILKKK